MLYKNNKNYFKQQNAAKQAQSMIKQLVEQKKGAMKGSNVQSAKKNERPKAGMSNNNINKDGSTPTARLSLSLKGMSTRE